MDKSMRDIPTCYQFLKPLKKLARVSQAQLGGVACFVIKNDAIISSGINYNPTGEPMEYVVDGKLVTRPEVIHAEIAALTAAQTNAIDVAGSTLFVTMSPCLACATRIATSGITNLVYLYEWWDKASLDILHGAGIATHQRREER